MKHTFADRLFWTDWKGWLIALAVGLPISAIIVAVVYAMCRLFGWE